MPFYQLDELDELAASPYIQVTGGNYGKVTGQTDHSRDIPGNGPRWLKGQGADHIFLRAAGLLGEQEQGRPH
jgi:hypothetical protein